MKKCLCILRVSSLRQDLTAQREAVLKAAREKYKASEIIEVQGKESAIKLDEMERQTLNEMKSIVEQYPSIESCYFFSVDSLMYTSPNIYLYINKGSVTELYWVSGKVDNLDDINVSEGLKSMSLIPIEDEIENRFTRG